MKDESIAELKRLVHLKRTLSSLEHELIGTVKRIKSQLESDSDFRDCVKANASFRSSGAEIVIEEDWYEYESCKFSGAIRVILAPSPVIDLDED